MFKQFMPDLKKIQSNKMLKIFGKALYRPNCWSLNRYSVSMAVAIGLFCAWLPFPGHMLASASLAVLCQAHVPLSLALVWISNPLTIPPQFYFAYRLGAFLLDIPPIPFHIELSWSWLVTQLLLIWKPLLLGSLLCGVVCAILGYVLTRVFWR